NRLETHPLRPRRLGIAEGWIAVHERRRSSPDSGSGRSPVLAKAARLLPRSPGPASPTDQCGAAVAGPLVSALLLERSARHRDALDFLPLAPEDLQTLLALEIMRRAATAAQGNPPAD